ncbi:MAG: hypothetical protein GXY55_03385 [Phycisphaerae bacterium]|nr:hypothetical protein [Phycisphaerae bacterium]
MKPAAYEETEGKAIDIPVHEIIMWIFTVAALALIGYGFFGGLESAVQEAAIFAASAAFGIIARIAQAGGHHDKLMRELQRRP